MTEVDLVQNNNNSSKPLNSVYKLIKGTINGSLAGYAMATFNRIEWGLPENDDAEAMGWYLGAMPAIINLVLSPYIAYENWKDGFDLAFPDLLLPAIITTNLTSLVYEKTRSHMMKRKRENILRNGSLEDKIKLAINN